MRLNPYNYSTVIKILSNLRQHREAYKISDLHNLHNNGNLFFLRFDVEYSPEIALKFAKQLVKIDIPATFYFHTRRSVFVPDIMLEIQSLNHEVGLHYECLDRCHGDFPAARKLFIEEVALFRKYGIDIKTASSHSELFLHKNGFLLNNELIMEYPELIKETSLLGDADSLIRRFNVIHAPDTFIRILSLPKQIRETRLNKGLHILLHSHRWSDNFFQSIHYTVNDIRQAWSNIRRGKREYDLFKIE